MRRHSARQRRGIAMVQHGVEVHRRRSVQSCASATLLAHRVGQALGQRGRAPAGQSARLPHRQHRGELHQPVGLVLGQAKHGVARQQRVDVRFAGRAGQRARTPDWRVRPRSARRRATRLSRPCAAAQSRSACSGAPSSGGECGPGHAAQRRRLAAAELQRASGRVIGTRAPAAAAGTAARRPSGPVPDRPSPPKGCTPTTAPTMLRLT